MSRHQVTAEIERLLHADDAPWQGYTYRALAEHVYDTIEPTSTQLSSVRRAVAALVTTGRAERHEDREWVGDKREGSSGTHFRRVLRRAERSQYTLPDGTVRRVTELVPTLVLHENPGGVLITRARTREEREAHEEELRKWAERDRELDR